MCLYDEWKQNVVQGIPNRLTGLA